MKYDRVVCGSGWRTPVGGVVAVGTGVGDATMRLVSISIERAAHVTGALAVELSLVTTSTVLAQPAGATVTAAD